MGVRTVKWIYSPARNQLLLELEYPNERWHRDRLGQYIYKCFCSGKKVKYVKFYRIGSL